MQHLNRIAPELPPQAMQTYRVLAPLTTHWRPASCEEAACEHYLAGWQTVVDERTELGERQAHFIRHDAERRHHEERQPDGRTAFTFPPGQRCFSSSAHRARVEREERFLITGGDYRGNPRGTRPRELSATAWVDDFGEHQDQLHEAHQRG